MTGLNVADTGSTKQCVNQDTVSLAENGLARQFLVHV